MKEFKMQEKEAKAKEPSKSYIGLPRMLLTLDMFSEPLPAFNIDGSGSVRTYCGGCVSLLMMYVIFLFAVLKFQHLISKHNPSVNTFVERDAFDENDVWVGSETDFMMAFAVTDYLTGEIKADKKFVKWFAQYHIQEDGEWSSVEVPMYECTEADFARFHKPSKSAAGMVKKY